MLVPSGNLAEWIGAATAGTLLLGALAKVVSVVQRGRAASRAGSQSARSETQRLELDRFEKMLDALNGDNARLREELAFERGKKEEYRRQNHELRNDIMKWMDQVQVMRLELDSERRLHGKGPWTPPNEDGDPR